MKNQRIVFTKINTAELLEVPMPEVQDDSILVKTAYTAISAGTERANITGDPNVSICCDGEVVFPRCCGYSSCGQVIKTGEKVTDVKTGDWVVMSWTSHSTYNEVRKENYVKVPDGVSLKEAAFCHIGTFPLAALRKVHLEIGESVLVMGAGILGVMAAAFAKAAGAVPVIVADPVKERREKALRMGADYALDPLEEGFAEKVKELSEGGIRAAIEVTGSGAGLNECLDCMAKFGRIALLGCTRDKNFTVDYYRKVHGPGITLVGAHTMARPLVESSPHAFTQKDDIKTILKLLCGKRISLDSAIDEIDSPSDCTEIYHRLIQDKTFPVFTLFDWNTVGQ